MSFNEQDYKYVAKFYKDGELVEMLGSNDLLGIQMSTEYSINEMVEALEGEELLEYKKRLEMYTAVGVKQ